jgi:tRNA G18 (ribose-2'-O)-methylase SpoU
LQSFRNPKDAYIYAKNQGYICIASEITSNSISVQEFQKSLLSCPVALIMGSETDGVLLETLELCEYVLHIPMQGIKESLNVAEAAAIMMWELC